MCRFYKENVSYSVQDMCHLPVYQSTLYGAVSANAVDTANSSAIRDK